MNNFESTLHPDHLADLRKSGLSDETILEAGIKSVCQRDIDKIFGYPTHAKSAYEIPYPGTDYSRYKMFYDEADKINPKTGDERPKYLAKTGSGNRLYIPHKTRPFLKDLSTPFYLTEGEKKALKATQEGIPCIAISGLWNWKVKNKDELIPDFNMIALDGRTVYIVPDSHFQEPDRHGNQKNLRQAVSELAYRLIDRGAKVYRVVLPKSDIEVKLDDYLCIHTIEDFKKLPVHPIRKLTIQEDIDGISMETPIDEIKGLLKRIADEVSCEFEKDIYLKELKEKRGITKTAMRKDIKTFGGAEEAKTQAERLIEIASEYKSFHDDTKEGYAYGNNGAVKIRSSQFKQLLSRTLWQTEGIAPNSDSLNQALNVIEAQAVHDNECIKLYNRIAEHENCFYYDLSDGRAVRVYKSRWEVVEKFPILFKRYPHQQKQVEPKRGGDIQSLFKFINVKDGRHKLLSLVYLVSCFVPGIPHPIFHPYGDQGACKTSLCTFFKLLIDPSKLDAIITPRNMEELTQILEHHYFCVFDNLSSFPDWLSDLLSVVCTGGGFSKRKLYTDDEDIIYQIQRCIVINGINLLVSRADLMDRTILLRMERIEPSERKEKKVLMQEFEEERPSLLGCFFDVLSKAMAIHPTVKLSNLPCMADFMTWGVAIARALGYEAEDFIGAYQANIEAQNSEIINSNTLAQAILIFMQGRENWSGTVKEVYEELGKLVTVSKDDRSFPKHFNKIRSHLNRIKANLLDYGIKFKIEDFDNHSKGVPISFQKVSKGCSVSSVSSVTAKIGGIQAEHPTEHPKVSSVLEPSKIKPTEDTEHTEDKIQLFWKEGETKKQSQKPLLTKVEVF